jgi:hypothetical protein
LDDHERDVLAHLAAGWDARAAELERTRVLADHALVYRNCAGWLRDAVLKLRAAPPAGQGPRRWPAGPV